MSTINHSESGISATTVLALVEALYAYAENPAQWDDITAAVEALPLPLDPDRDPEALTIMGHASRAAAMIDRLNAGRPDQKAGTENNWDAILLSSEQRVRGVAGYVEERLKPFLEAPVRDGEMLALSPSAARAIGTPLSGLRSGAEPSLVPFTLGAVNDRTRCFGVILPREAFPPALAAAFGLGDVWAEPLSAIVLLSAKEPHAADRLVHGRFGLTSAESRLAAKLLQGLTVQDAAADLGVSMNTVRTQLKSIFSKTGARRQSDLLRLLTSATEFPEQPASNASQGFPGSPPRRFVTLHDGRRLYYREYGVPSGLPVIYFHLGLSASLVAPASAAAALARGVRLISFERPGFGQSDPRPDYTFEAIAQDVEELCRRLDLPHVALFGDGYGGGFAVAVARRLGPAIVRLALHAPNLGRATGTNQRAGLSVLYSQPWIIPAASEMLRRGLRVTVIRSLLGYIAEKSNADAARIADPAFSAYLNATIFDALERTSAGLASELSMFGHHAKSDPSDLTCPIAVWHGEENSSVPVSNTITDFERHPHARLHVLPGVGLYLKQAVYEDIFGWLAGTKKKPVANPGHQPASPLRDPAV